MKQEDPAARLESPAFRRGENVNDPWCLVFVGGFVLVQAAALLLVGVSDVRRCRRRRG